MNLAFLSLHKPKFEYVFKVISGSQDDSRKLSRVKGIIPGLSDKHDSRYIPQTNILTSPVGFATDIYLMGTSTQPSKKIVHRN